MKPLFHRPILIYATAIIACLGIMVIVDYVLGARAEYLNAWVILNRLVRHETGIAESLTIQHFGLAGAALLMLLVNSVFGLKFIQLLRLFIRINHA